MNEHLPRSILVIASSPEDLAYWRPLIASWPTLDDRVAVLDSQTLLDDSPTALVADGPAKLTWRVLEQVQATRPTVVVGTAASGALALSARARDLGLLDWDLRLIAWHDAPFPLDAARGARFLDDPFTLDLDALHRETIARADAVVAPQPSANMPQAVFDEQLRVSAVPRNATVWRGLAERVRRRELPPPPSSWPDVSVCITHYQRPEFLRQALDAVWAQHYPGQVEVIVIDDGSPEAAVQSQLDSIGQLLTARGGMLLRQPNRYLGAARNAAARAATGDILVFVDDDDCMAPGYLQILVGALQRSGAALVSCAFDYFTGTSAPGPGTPLHHRWVMLGGSPVRQIADNGFGGANIVMRRDAFDQLGGFTEDRDVGCEDWEFYHRAALAGLSHVAVPAPLLRVRMGIGGMQQRAPDPAPGAYRAIRPVVQAMPELYADLPLLLQGTVRRTVHLEQQQRQLDRHRRQLQDQLHTLNEWLSSGRPVDIRQHRPLINEPQGPACYVWHDEGMGVSGILAWMWRLRGQFAPVAALDLKLVDLGVFPYHSEQMPVPSVLLYDERIDDADAFLAFLARTADAVHVINHGFRYLDSLLVDGDDTLLRLLRLVAVCHTDQDFYYDNIERFAPYLRAIIAVSPQCAAELTRRLPDMRDRIFTLPAWAVTPPANESPARAPADPLRLLYTGRIVQHQKRVFDLVTLATMLGRAGVYATLTIVGDGPDLEALRARCAEASGCIQVTLLPARAPWDMPELLATHHVLVQTSAFEGASVSLMEAMSYGLVPVVTQTVSGQELTRHGHNALTAPVGDVALLAQHVAQLTDDDAQRRRLAEAARATAVEYLGRLDYANRFANVIRRVAAETI